METSIKKKGCKSCGADFIPFRTFDKFCSAECKIKKEDIQKKKELEYLKFQTNVKKKPLYI